MFGQKELSSEILEMVLVLKEKKKNSETETKYVREHSARFLNYVNVAPCTMFRAALNCTHR